MFSLNDIYNYTIFGTKINNFVTNNCNYSVYIKIRYYGDSFITAGCQFGFNFNDVSSNIPYLWDEINNRLEESFNQYSLTNHDVVYVQIYFRIVDTKLVSGLYKHPLSLDDLSIGVNKKLDNILNIPVYLDNTIFENKLNTTVDSNNYINYIGITIYNKTINFMDLIKNKARYIKSNNTLLEKKDTSFDSLYKFYVFKGERFNYVLAI